MTLLYLLIAGSAFVPVCLFILRRWQRGFYFLLLWIPLSGIPTLLSNYSPIAILFKDFAFIMPMYVGYFCFLDKQRRFDGIPRSFSCLLLAQVVLVLLHMVNPNLSNSKVAFIGAKVWLYYMPLLLVAYSFATSREDLIKLLRPVVAVSWIPAVVGVTQWILSTTIGYYKVMTMFYGPAARAATQGFQHFFYGISLFRLPSTFTFAAQYSTYLWAALLTSYMLAGLETSSRWRIFAKLSFVLAIVASFLSGARGAFFFIPLLLLLTYTFHHGLKGVLKMLLVVVVLLVPLSMLVGLDLKAVSSNVWILLVHYSQESLQSEFFKAVELAPLGLGTGMNTIAARYACLGGGSPCTMGIENYYGKAIVELGLAGGAILVAWQLVLITTTFRCSRLLRSSELRTITSACGALFIVMFISNVKSFRLDYEPLNMYYWIFVGFALRINAIVLKQEETTRLEKLAESSGEEKQTIDATGIE